MSTSVTVPLPAEEAADLASDDGRAFAEDRRARRRRGRVVGFLVCVPLWLLSAVPLALLSTDDGGGAGVAAAYLVAGLGIAVVARAIYALLRKRSFWSPSIFVIAAVLALMSYVVQSAGDEPIPITGAQAHQSQVW